MNHAVGKNPVAVGASDFNKTGLPALAVANHGSDNVSVLRNLGAGNFAASANFGVGGGPGGIVTADFDGDGRPDAVLPCVGGNVVTVLLAKGVMCN